MSCCGLWRDIRDLLTDGCCYIESGVGGDELKVETSCASAILLQVSPFRMA